MAQQRRKSRGASRQSKARSGSSPALRWYSLGLVSGLFIAFMFYLVTLPPDGAVEAETPVAATGSDPVRPRYEFYEVLPSQEITIDVDPADIPPPRQAGTGDGKQFLLQAGSFRQHEDAERHRAKLLLLGLEPRIEESRGDTGRWFRVILGPFDSRSSMARARSLTAQEDIDTLLIQRRVN